MFPEEKCQPLQKPSRQQKNSRKSEVPETTLQPKKLSMVATAVEIEQNPNLQPDDSTVK